MRKLLYIAALVLCAACEKTDNWQPGEQVPAGTPVVYFASDNSATVLNYGTETASFNIVLERIDTEGELTVPIVVNNVTGDVNIPQSATFADGDDRTYLPITYTYSPGVNFSLSIGAGFGNPYADVEGALNYVCSVSRLARIARVKYKEDSTLGDVESYICSYDGLNKFVFTNFMDSGVDVTFTIETIHTGVEFDPENLRTLKGDFKPLDNIYYDGSGWYLYDENSDNYPNWTPAGWEKTVLYYYFYGYSEDYNYSYSYIDLTTDKYKSYFYGSSFYFDEGFTDYVSPAVYYALDFDFGF